MQRSLEEKKKMCGKKKKVTIPVFSTLIPHITGSDDTAARIDISGAVSSSISGVTGLKVSLT